MDILLFFFKKKVALHHDVFTMNASRFAINQSHHNDCIPMELAIRRCYYCLLLLRFSQSKSGKLKFRILFFILS